MKPKGQVSLETMVVLGALLSLLAIFVAAFGTIGAKSSEAEQKMLAIAKAQACGTTADAIVANSGGKPGESLHNCVSVSPHQIQATEGPFPKTAFTLAEKMEMVQYGSETILEVKAPVHYQ